MFFCAVKVGYDERDNIDDYKTNKREISALVKAANETGCDNLTVITWDHEAKETSNGKEIHYLPLWKWLL